MIQYTESGLEAQSTRNMHSEISLQKDPDSCHYQIQFWLALVSRRTIIKFY